ncbi:hypothetical protein FRX31_024933 [Thalictrum thalictroides]|uniref:Uncharacterized protein n=1 Tax=Thalictrum thalictroides TaxID=46969 RepID=A0A7J6VMV7_THATH|nr:hypothetical protein FRX31_024933 [Thalictrum thalictroides]
MIWLCEHLIDIKHRDNYENKIPSIARYDLNDLTAFLKNHKKTSFWKSLKVREEIGNISDKEKEILDGSDNISLLQQESMTMLLEPVREEQNMLLLEYSSTNERVEEQLKDYNDLKDNAEYLQDENNNLKRDLQAKDQEMENKKEDIENLKFNLENLLKQNEDLKKFFQEENKQLKMEVRELKNENAEMKKQVNLQAKDHEKEKREKELEILKVDLQAKDKELEKREKDIEILKVDNEDLNKRVEKLQQEMENLKQKHNNSDTHVLCLNSQIL